ncbi:MAG: Rpp14/Pop5 family protein [Halovenus sp.]
MKHLPKHLQPRFRYLAVTLETWPAATVEREAFQRALWFSAQNLLGDVGSAALDLSVLQFEHRSGRGRAIVRTRRDAVPRARATIAAVDSVDGTEVGLRVRGVSGTVRACEEKYMSRPLKVPEERNVAFEGTEQSAVVRGSRVDVRADGAVIGATTTDLE